MAGARHRPYIDYSRGPQPGGLAAVACRDCGWTQAVSQDLHEDHEDRLLAWHAAHPGEGTDHLAGFAPGMRLEIPGYVLWAGNGSGGAAVADQRTGGAHDSYNHACLAIFTSVAEHGNLEGANASEARRLGISPGRTSGDVRLTAASLYRAGLLGPALASRPEQRGPGGGEPDD